jgi:hypothetical protein
MNWIGRVEMRARRRESGSVKKRKEGEEGTGSLFMLGITCLQNFGLAESSFAVGRLERQRGPGQPL